MNNSDAQNKTGGFLSRIFRKGAASPPLPAEVIEESANGSEIAMSASPGGRRLAKAKSVLIIAADDGASRRWRREIEEWGYGLEAVAEGPKGLEILYAYSYDAVLLDIEAPKINGLDVLRQIRAQAELKSLFIGAFARDKDGHSEQEMAALEAGANRVFQRGSVSVDEILTSLKTALFPRVLQAQPRAKQQAPAVQQQRSSPALAPKPTVISAPKDLVAPAAHTPVSVNKKVLIIDADETVAGIYRAQIEAAGYEVEVALDGETGFHDLYRTSPDALLLDMLLPGLSGSEILKKTRAQKKFEKTPILVFTNIYTRDVEEEAKAAGVLRLFNKAAATPRDVVDALNEIFLPTSAVLGGGGRASIRFDGKGSKGESAPVTAASGANDVDFQLEIREAMLQGAPEIVKSLRGLLQVLLRSHGDRDAQAAQLLELYSRVHSLTANAAIAGFSKVARLSGALEAMLREFHSRPEGLNPSTRRTLTQAMDFLAQLFTGAATHESGLPLDEQILVVDDEIISRRVIGHSLEKAGLKSMAVSHPDEALKLLEERSFHLVFLDVEMPGMNGFELCKKLRAMPYHAKTPVIFVTALNGFESRAKSSLSGGDDFIGKPFSYIELAVKALMYVLRGTMADGGASFRKAALPAAVPVEAGSAVLAGAGAGRSSVAIPKL